MDYVPPGESRTAPLFTPRISRGLQEYDKCLSPSCGLLLLVLTTRDASALNFLCVYVFMSWLLLFCVLYFCISRRISRGYTGRRSHRSFLSFFFLVASLLHAVLNRILSRHGFGRSFPSSTFDLSAHQIIILLPHASTSSCEKKIQFV